MPHKGNPTNNNHARNYSHEEILVIQQHLDKSNEEIQEVLKVAGHSRTIGSIKQIKHKLKMKKQYVKS